MSHPLIDFLALAIVVLYPAIPVVLILFHGFVRFWRKIGPAVSYAIFISLFLLVDLAILGLVLKFKNTLLTLRWYNHPAALAGAIILIPSTILGLKSIRTLSWKVLLALPEVKPAFPAKLVATGIYKYLRHPRYLEFILEVIAVAILSGLVVNYLLFIYFLPAIYLASHIEERELIERFGESYRNYKQKTGRFWPKIN